MIDLKRILVPSDFSKYSNHAVLYGCAFAERFGAELHLLHVMADMVPLMPDLGLSAPNANYALPLPPDYWENFRRSAEEGLWQSLNPEWESKLTVRRVVLQGPPFLEIIRYARQETIDLIVVGSHGRTGLAHMLLGSVADKVVHKAPCPVLTVHHPEHEFVMP